MKKWLLILLFSSPLFGLTNYGSTDFRAGIGVGIWTGRFEMEGNGHHSLTNMKASVGVEAHVGFRLSIFFLEYHLSWFLSPYSKPPRPKDSSYFSPVGAVLGVAFPPFPFEFFGGVEYGRYALAEGTEPVYTNLVYKGGVNYNFGRPEVDPIAARFEYKRMPAYKDNLGHIPYGFMATAHIFFLSVVVKT